MRTFRNVASVLLLLILTATATAERPYCGRIISDLPSQKIVAQGKIWEGAIDFGSFSVVSDKHILTNWHNVRDYLEQKGLCNECRVTLVFFNGETREGEVLDVHQIHDLALVGVVGGIPDGAFRIKIAETYKTDAVTIAGYPGTGPYKEQTHRGVSDVGNHVFQFPGEYRTGSSGSPVINSKGEQCGILFASDLMVPEREGPPSGYATKAEQIREFLEKNGLTP